jgi:hypothetical protein
MATVNTIEAMACTAVVIAIVLPRKRVDEISEMMTKQMGPTVIWYVKVQMSISVAWAQTAPEWERPKSRKPMMKRMRVMNVMPEL